MGEYESEPAPRTPHPAASQLKMYMVEALYKEYKRANRKDDRAFSVRFKRVVLRYINAARKQGIDPSDICDWTQDWDNVDWDWLEAYYLINKGLIGHLRPPEWDAPGWVPK